MKPINVIAITLTVRNQPVMIMGSLSENALHVISVTLMRSSISAVRQQIEDLAANLAASNEDATIYIEDPTGLLRSAGGYKIRLDDKTSDGRPLLAVAMERYRSMTALNSITYPTSGGEGLTISNSIMNVKVGDNGRAIYEIDWDSLKDGSRALLLLIYGAMCQGPMQADYLKRMYASLGDLRGNNSGTVASGFAALTTEFDLDRSSAHPSIAVQGVTL
ncbi:MAG: hypothetical protein ACRC8Q_12120 [Aeromonas sp.]